MIALIYMILTGIAMFLGYTFAESPDTNVQAVCLAGVVLIMTLDVLQIRKSMKRRYGI